MKRLLAILPVFLFILLNACGSTPEKVPDVMGTAVGQTQTAAVWTPTITNTPDPNEANIVEWLNNHLSETDELERTLDATYRVLDVSFPFISGTSSRVLKVDIRCECTLNMECCSPERMFVLVILAMKAHDKKMLDEVPTNVSEMNVVCLDRVTQIGVMFALWTDVKDYLRGQINGYQLGGRVHRTAP